MAGIYVAWKEPISRKGPRVAHPNLNVVRELIRKDPGSTWTIARYTGKWTVDLVCQAIVDPTELYADAIVGEFRVWRSGRVQKKRVPAEKKRRKNGARK